MYFIEKRENHPDRIVDEYIGPFATREEADATATYLQNAPANFFLHMSRIFHYTVHSLELRDEHRLPNPFKCTDFADNSTDKPGT